MVTVGFAVRLFLPLVLVVVMEFADLVTTYISVCLYGAVELNPNIANALGDNCDISRALFMGKLPNIVAEFTLYFTMLLILRYIRSPGKYLTFCKFAQIILFGYCLLASILAVAVVNNIIVIIFGVGIGNVFGDYWSIATVLIGVIIMIVAMLILGNAPLKIRTSNGSVYNVALDTPLAHVVNLCRLYIPTAEYRGPVSRTLNTL